MNKYDDIAETLNGVFVMVLTGALIVGLAPFVIFLQASTF